jgi:branched-chain amino acid transport system substrate-binding protein
MFTSKTKMAGAVLAVGLLAAACGAPGGNSDSGGGHTSAAAAAAAKALGIDLAKCPTDVTKKFGATVKVGNTVPQTGPVAPALGVIGPALKAGFELYGQEAGLGTKFEVVSLDDAFTPDKALTSTQTLLDKDKVDLMSTVVGTAQVAAIRQVLNDECVPLLPAVSGGTSANDPSKFPWTAVFTQPSAVDARIMMADITANHPDGAKVAVLYSNNESGKDYLAALDKYRGKNTIVKTQTIEETETNSPSSQITTLRSSGANVLIAAGTASQCPAIMQEVANQGWKPDRYMTSVCSSPVFDVAGQAADGWHVTTYIKDSTRGEGATDPDVLAAAAAIKKFAPNTPVNTTSLGGVMYAQAFFEAAKAAAKSPLGLSRLGMINAFTHLDYKPSLLKDGINFKLDGLKDQVGIEASYMSVYDAKTKQFTDGKLYNFEGQMTQ